MFLLQLAPLRPPLPPSPTGLPQPSAAECARLIGSNGKFGQVVVHTGDFRFDGRMKCVFSKEGPRSPPPPDLSHLPIDAV